MQYYYYYPSCHLFSIKRDLLYKYHRPIMIIMYNDNENYILHFDRLNIFLLYSCWFVPFLRHKEEAKAPEWTNGMRVKLIKDPKKIKKIIYIYICMYRRNFCLVFKIIEFIISVFVVLVILCICLHINNIFPSFFQSFDEYVNVRATKKKKGREF